MNPLLHKLKRLTFILIAVFFIFILLWIVTLFSSFYGGIALGLWIGLISTVYTAFKVYRFAEAIASGRRSAGIGTGIRIALVVVGVLVSLKFPQYADVKGFALGLFITQVFVLGDAIYTAKK